LPSPGLRRVDEVGEARVEELSVVRVFDLDEVDIWKNIANCGTE